jgi:hypothetical protein
MVNGNLTVIPQYLIEEIGNLAIWFKAIGGLIMAYIIFSIVNVIWNKKRRDELRKIRRLLESIDNNISKLIKK